MDRIAVEVINSLPINDSEKLELLSIESLDDLLLRLRSVENRIRKEILDETRRLSNILFSKGYSIESAIDYFAEKEEYEKCQFIVRFKEISEEMQSELDSENKI